MFRQPRYLGMPRNHWQAEVNQRHHWWLIALMLLAAIFVIGVRATGMMMG
jgi:hypothetical protein